MNQRHLGKSRVIALPLLLAASMAEASADEWTTSDPKGRYVPNGPIAGDWTAGIPRGESAETPLSRLNLGISMEFYMHTHSWDINNERVGVYFRS